MFIKVMDEYEQSIEDGGGICGRRLSILGPGDVSLCVGGRLISAVAFILSR